VAAGATVLRPRQRHPRAATPPTSPTSTDTPGRSPGTRSGRSATMARCA
jgi:hypothetical protein